MKRDSAPIFRDIDSVRRFIADAGAKRIVLANGGFDPLHVGHVRYLEDAKTHGDCLVVAINNDESTKRLKGPLRPVVAETERARLVAALEPVDAVVLFAESDVTAILERLRPDVHAKGTDYTAQTVPERAVAQRLGIETVITGDPKTHASRDIVARVRDGGPNGGGRKSTE